MTNRPVYAHGFLALTIAMLLFAVLPALAQEPVVTDDEVNAIASKLYCPVCENIPLDTCGTAACRDWREGIRSQLESGMTEQEVINDFVTRYGDRVVGTPIDPTLRALSLVTPWVLGAVIVLGALWTFLRWRNRRVAGADQPVIVPVPNASGKARDDEYYQARLEQDLQARR